jgi:hypothetical protein
LTSDNEKNRYEEWMKEELDYLIYVREVTQSEFPTLADFKEYLDTLNKHGPLSRKADYMVEEVYDEKVESIKEKQLAEAVKEQKEMTKKRVERIAEEQSGMGAMIGNSITEPLNKPIFGQRLEQSVPRDIIEPLEPEKKKQNFIRRLLSRLGF